MLEVKSNKWKEEGGLMKEMSASYCFKIVGQKIDEGKCRGCSVVEDPLEILNYNLKWTGQHSCVFFFSAPVLAA